MTTPQKQTTQRRKKAPKKIKEYVKLQYSENDKFSDTNTELFTLYKNIVEQEASYKERDLEVPVLVSKQKTLIKNKLVEKNQALVSYMINKCYNKAEYKKYHYDLFQEGVIGLMSAIDGFDLSLGYKFSTYSTWWIRQAMNTYIADFVPAIHVPPHIRAARNKLLKNVSNQEDKKNFSSKLFEESEKLGYTNKMTKAIISAMDSKKVISISTYANSGTEDQESTSDLFGHEPSVESKSEEMSDSRILISAVSKSLKKMSDKNRNILLLRFNVIDENEVKPKKKGINEGRHQENVSDH